MTKFSHAIDSACGLSSNDAEVDQLLHPAHFYARPADVLADELLSVEERRAILASWASDACAVYSNPPLRRPSSAQAPVTFDEIMDALRQLDTMRGTVAVSPVNVRLRRKHRKHSNLADAWQHFQRSTAHCDPT